MLPTGDKFPSAPPQQALRQANEAFQSPVWSCSFPRVTLNKELDREDYSDARPKRHFLGHTNNRMTSRPGLHLKTYLAIFVIVIFAPLGSVLLGKGMKGVGSAATWTFNDLLPVFLRILSNGYIWLGIGSLLTFFVAYMMILSWADYSYVQPSTSLSYATVAILSHFFLGELITPLRWLGVAIICTGVFIVGRTSPRAHGAH